MTDTRRSFLCIIDKTPELNAAIRYTAKRAAKTNAHIVLLGIIQLEDGGSEMLLQDVHSMLHAEQREEIERLCFEYERIIFDISRITPSIIITEGYCEDVIKRKIEEYPDIKILILGTNPGDNPGPIVRSLTQGELGLRIPVTLVPGDLKEDEIDNLT